MSDNAFRAAKVLLLEHCPQHYQLLLDFCAELGLQALPRTAVNALAALAEHQDLAGVLLAEDLPGASPSGLGMAVAIHRQRPELPIFLRRVHTQPLAAAEAAAIKHDWQGPGTETLRAAVERSLYGLRYPPELVQGVLELTTRSIASMFPHAEVSHEAPYVVHDRIIFGEVSTLIALESTWCRGYMMLQTEEGALRQGLLQGYGMAGVGGDLNFRELNNLLGETTNLIWGAFKNRYIPPEAFANQQTQVPIVINHQHKYMSFGSQDPQLCVRYLLTDPRRPGLPPLTIVQRLIFNLLWLPEKFTEYAAPQHDGASTGELELF